MNRASFIEALKRAEKSAKMHQIWVKPRKRAVILGENASSPKKY
jgi:hypothetical protein